MPEPIEAHCGWTAATLRGLASSVAILLIGLLLVVACGTPQERGAGVFTAVLGGVLTLVMVLVSGIRRIALRVDERGVLLGGPNPLTHRKRTVLVPWEQITEVELWTSSRQSRTGVAVVPYVGLHRVPGLPRLPGPERLQRVLAERAGKGPELVNASRPMHLVKLDPAILSRAIRAFAPGLPITVDPRFPAQVPAETPAGGVSTPQGLR